MTIKHSTITALVAVISVGNAALGAGVTMTRDTALGARFGTPGPRKCVTANEPRGGAISADQARAYVICGYEGQSDGLHLLGQVKVQVGRGRPYEHVKDSLSDIDPHKQVFDIRGTSVAWSCLDPKQMPSVMTRAQQCTRTVWNTAEGKCFQTTFGDWRCTWSDFNAPMITDTRLRVPAPSPADAE